MKDAMFDRPPSARLQKETVHEASRDPQAGDRRRQGGVQHGDRVSPREGAAPASSQQACQGTAATRSSPEYLGQRDRPHAAGGGVAALFVVQDKGTLDAAYGDKG